jgi:hypothetical protein
MSDSIKLMKFPFNVLKFVFHINSIYLSSTVCYSITLTNPYILRFPRIRERKDIIVIKSCTKLCLNSSKIVLSSDSEADLYVINRNLLHFAFDTKTKLHISQIWLSTVDSYPVKFSSRYDVPSLMF